MAHPTSSTAPEKHPHFELWLHDTESLATALGRPILSRETIHDWPLSCVQRIECPGETIIYKTQRPPTVEPAFYRAASSGLLPDYRYLGDLNGCHTMTFEFVAGDVLAERPLDARELLAIGTEVQEQIAKIEGVLPVYTDIRDRERWSAFTDTSLERLVSLDVPADTVARLRDWAGSTGVLELIATESAFCHGDLNDGNVFLVNDQFKLVDWQRTRFGPRSVDLAALLLSKGHDPFAHLPREAVQMLFFLMLAWCAECHFEFIPQVDYRPMVLSLASRLLEAP